MFLGHNPEDYHLPADYTFATNSWGDSFFKVYPEVLDFNAARARCESDGAYLPAPMSDAENNFILGLRPEGDFWLGVYDVESVNLLPIAPHIGEQYYEERWKLLDGSDVKYTNFILPEYQNYNERYAAQISGIGRILIQSKKYEMCIAQIIREKFLNLRIY